MGSDIVFGHCTGLLLLLYLGQRKEHDTCMELDTQEYAIYGIQSGFDQPTVIIHPTDK